MLADLLRAGQGVREIGRAASTISREIHRNVDADGGYRPHHAEQAARARVCRPRPRRITLDTVLGETVMGLLAKRWSPEQVAHELHERFAEQRDRRLCPESIDQAIYDSATTVTRPARRRRRRRRLQGLQRRGRLTAMRMLDERPLEAQDRQQPGHWEGDLIMGPGNRLAIETLVERSTRFVILMPLPDGVPTAQEIRRAICDVFGRLSAGLRRTLACDQGKELAHHQQITQLTGTPVFFCDPHAPWQRGSNENMNGLLRDYFSEGTDLSGVSAQQLVEVAAELNDRPRKTLGWQRPSRLFDAALIAA